MLTGSEPRGGGGGGVRPHQRWTDNRGEEGGGSLLDGFYGEGVVGHRSGVRGFYRRALLFVLLWGHLMMQECFRNDLDWRERERG